MLLLFARVQLFVMAVGSVILIWKLIIVLCSVSVVRAQVCGLNSCVWPIKMKTTAEQQFLVVSCGLLK